MNVLVIGCGAETQKAKEIAAKIGNDNIVFVENPEDVQVSVFDQVIESRKIELIARPVEMLFIPKAKHQPKGHERPYKYHR